MESILDAEMPEQVIWPAQRTAADSRGSRHSLEKRKVGGSTRPRPPLFRASARPLTCRNRRKRAKVMASTAVSRTKIPTKPTTTARLRAVWFTGLARSVVSGLRFRFGECAGTECCEQSFGGWVWPVSLGEVGADVAGGLGGDLDVVHVGTAGEGEAGDEGDADSGADEGAHEAVVAGAAGDAGMEAADSSEHVQDAADLAPAVDPAFAGELGQADG